MRCEVATDWAADGRSLLVQLRAPGSTTGTVALWDLADSTSTPLFDDVSAETGAPELFVRPFRSGGRAVRLTTGDARSPKWRRDGRVTPDGQQFVVRMAASDNHAVLVQHWQSLLGSK